MLRAKANPILAEQGQEAPLSLAVRTGSLDYVRLLLHYRAVPAIPDVVNGSVVLSQAKKLEMDRVMQIASSSPAILKLFEAAISEHGSSDHANAMPP